jgi:hypothetical protein
MTMRDCVQKTLDNMHDLVIKIDDHANVHLAPFYNMLEGALQWMDAVLTDKIVLHAAYNASRAETAALKAAVDTLTWKFNEQITIPAPPSPDLTASSTMIEEIMMQLSIIQHDIKDILEAVCNPPGKRK